MKRMIAMFMTVICLTVCCGNMIVRAEGYVYCPYCKATLRDQGEHLDHWYTYHTFTDNQGKSITCTEYHTVDRIVKVCPKGCGVVWTGEAEEKVSHSLAVCPYK